MLEVRNIAFAYRAKQVLRDVSFVVSPGETVSVVGDNGAGKTTLLRILATLMAPDAGSVRIDGHDAFLTPLRYRRELGYLQETPAHVEFHTIYADEQKHEAWYVPISFFSASMIEGEAGYFDVLPMFFLNEESHQTYLDTITARSMWKAPTDVTTDDKLIMLITCSYDLDDSRYLLICRQLREDETPEEMEKLYKNGNP